MSKKQRLDLRLKLHLPRKQQAFYDPLQRLLQKEGDRGAILVAAAHVDDLLAQLLARHFVDDSKLREELLEAARPIGTFSSRISLAFALGKLCDDDRKTLDALRAIRNDVAHRLEVEPFGSDIADRIRAMPYADYCTSFFTSPPSPRQLLEAIVTLVIASLAAEIKGAKHCRPPESLWTKIAAPSRPTNVPLRPQQTPRPKTPPSKTKTR